MLTKEWYDGVPEFMKKKLKQRFYDLVPFPVLYDASMSYPDKDGNWHVIASRRGWYDYDRDIFKVPKAVVPTLQEQYPDDWAIIEMVGYELKG